MATPLTIQNTMHISYNNTPILGLLLCSLYKSAPLQGMPQNAPYPYDDVSLGHILTGQVCTICPVLEDRQAIVVVQGLRCHFDSKFRSTFAKDFTDSSCLQLLQITEGGPERVRRGMA